MGINGKFAFSSEISSFSFIPEFLPNLDFKAVSCYFQRGYISAPLSIWENIKKIMPGSITEITFNENKNYFISNEEIYWSAKRVAVNGQKNLFKGSYESCKNEIKQTSLSNSLSVSWTDK